MKTRRIVAMLLVLVLGACGGGGVTPNGLATVAASPTPPQSTGVNLVRERFTFLPPAANSTNSAHHPLYVTDDIASVEITLDSVNGAQPSTGAPLSVTTNLTITSCPCTIYGPSVPPGTDTFTLVAYDEPNATGNVISAAMPTYTIASGATNIESVTLDGVPASLALAVPSATAGTAFASPQSISVTAKDADGNTIMGSYANAVTLNDADGSGATSLTTSGGDNPPADQLLSSSDVATINYTGLAIAPALITADAKGATASASFAPALQPVTITASDAQNPGFAGVDLYATSGTGSSATFTASEVGWTNSPYNRALVATAASSCNSIATVAPASGTSFTATAASTPVPGTCTLTLSDGSGQSQTVTLAYTQFTYSGAAQSIVVPAGLTSIAITAYGAQGETCGFSGNGGPGGETQGTLTVNGGDTLYVVVGGTFGNGGGFNGGGSGAGATGPEGGGGASDVRLGSALEEDRVVVAGGGGGGDNSAGLCDSGGAGGGLVGGAPSYGTATGGTQTAGGSGGSSSGNTGQSGALGVGGNAAPVSGGYFGGGGGGYYGGGGGAGSPGAGGSSYYDTSVTNASTTPGVRTGNGLVILIW